MLAVVCWFKRCRRAAFEERCGKGALRRWAAGQGGQLGIYLFPFPDPDLTLSRSLSHWEMRRVSC